MLNKTLPALALCLFVSACGDSRATAPAVGRATPSANPSAAPSLPADVVVNSGAITVVRGAKHGSLYVDVQRRTEPAGRVTTTVAYEYKGPCKREQVAPKKFIVSCPVLWTAKRKVSEAAFTIDVDLGKASLTDTLRGKKLTVAWTGYGETRRQANVNGNLLAETRDAIAGSRWGTLRHVDKKDAAVPSVMFRRVPEPGTP